MASPRIAVVSTYYHPVVGGCETHARQVSHYLSTHGFDVRIYTRRTPPGAPAHDVDQGVRVRRLGPAGERKGLGKWLLVGPMLVELWRRRHSYDLIFCVDLRGMAIATWAAARLAGKPVVFQAETPGAIGLDNWDAAARSAGGIIGKAFARVVRRALRPIYAAGDAYTCIASQFIDEGIAAGVARDRLHYVPHAVDERRFRPPTPGEQVEARARLGLPLDRPVVMFLGRLGIEKGILDLLHAWMMLAHPSAVLAVVGPDMPGHALDAGPAARAFVKENGLEDSVAFLGPTDDPAPVLAAADIFVQPSHYEAFGISLIEAMATGLAIAASGVGGMRDYLVDGDNALVTGAHAPERLASSLSVLLGDVALRTRLAAAARRTVEERFTEEAIGRAYAELFRSLIGSTEGPPDPGLASQRPA